MRYDQLTKSEIIDVIEGKGHAKRIPVVLHFWNNPGAFSGDRIKQVSEIQAQYPQDVDIKSIEMPKAFEAPHNDPAFRWMNYKDERAVAEKHGLDGNCYIEDMESEIDLFVSNMPSAGYPDLFSGHTKSDGTAYTLFHWWYCLFERQWWLRGMENALTDFYIYPDETHKLFRGLTEFYKKLIIRAKKELNVDGIFTSDDIGTQASPFFSLAIFREFFKPYYKELIDTAHENGMHFWLHTCGNIEPFIPELIEIGLDVLHPIQKYTMDQAEISKKYGDKICIWAGFDVQQIIPYGTAGEVEEEVKRMIDTYYRQDGRFMLTAGNGITGDCPLSSLEALYKTCFEYGAKKCSE